MASGPLKIAFQFRHCLAVSAAEYVATKLRAVSAWWSLLFSPPPTRWMSFATCSQRRLAALTACLVAGWVGWSHPNPGFRDDSNPPQVWLALLGWIGSNP